MKKSLMAIISLILTLILALPVFATGNGAPSGEHFNLNVIGMSNAKSADMTKTDGHVIFVPLQGKVSISLSEGPFSVLDGNGTDGKAAFQLPNPDPTNSGITQYSVFVRGLGKPGGKSITTPYIIDPVTGETWYSTGSVSVSREKGKTSFTNVSKDLLYVYADVNGDGVVERIPLFGDSAYQYFWEYNNTGLKLAQFRFYPVSTNVN